MTHSGMTAEELEGAGVTPGLVRLAVGCEDVEDLRSDLAYAVAAAALEVEATSCVTCA